MRCGAKCVLCVFCVLLFFGNKRRLAFGVLSNVIIHSVSWVDWMAAFASWLAGSLAYQMLYRNRANHLAIQYRMFELVMIAAHRTAAGVPMLGMVAASMVVVSVFMRLQVCVNVCVGMCVSANVIV